jgi:hypothetical protein
LKLEEEEEDGGRSLGKLLAPRKKMMLRGAARQRRSPASSGEAPARWMASMVGEKMKLLHSFRLERKREWSLSEWGGRD